MEVSSGKSLFIALGLTLLLVALHWSAPRIRRLPLVPESVTGSFAGGLAVAYVFLHLLPEVAGGNEAIGAVLDDVLEPTPLVELGVFFVALVGFVVFLALQRAADSVGATRMPVAVGGAAGEGETGGRGVGLYRLHLGSFVLYNALLTYTMPLRVRTGVAFAVLFAVAMGLHFVVTDRELVERYPRRFGRSGRVLLGASLFVGWLAAALLAPTSPLVVAVLTALLAGSVLLNVFKEEIPTGTTSSFPWFLVGLVVYTGLLTGATALSG